ncbi:MAG: alkaline phosphatase family protein [Candidatus Aminicenantes bacterium]|nr:alkaline phosphatase family protein [Candidatus Aminicenantes bacterium]
MRENLQKRVFVIVFFLFVITAPLKAYVGPGAGFAFLSSFLVLFLTFFLAVFSFLSWPFRFFIRLLKGQKAYKLSHINQLVIVGLDGMEPTLVEKFMSEGKLPNLAKLKKTGAYARLKTTIPAISPVAWSSFMTGCNPCKHNIFDFLSRDPKTYLPDLSSARIGNPKKFLPLGKYKIPLSKPEIRGMRKSVPFWKILGDSGIFSTILRIPITFPPEKFRGHLISGMCAPDLKGSQGTFSFYTSETDKIEKHEGGMNIPVSVDGDVITTYISGPENSLLKQEEEMRLPMTIRLDKEKEEVLIEVSGQKIPLKKGAFSDWIKIHFSPGLGMKIRAICRFFVSEMHPHFKMYLTPLNIDPEKPALPISHPFIYSVYLAKLLGDYNTLGEADDTWALNEGILSEDSFIELTYDNHRESERMLFNAMDKTKKGVVACWFQTTDSIQHMFFRYLDKKHPALKHGQKEKSAAVIEDLYKDMDELVGRVFKKLNKKSILVVMSDHGFKSFRRGVNLNSWLYQNGYLHLKNGKTTSGEWFKDVDWTRTKAYALGLGGIYINQKGRESQGIVGKGEETKLLKEELAVKLNGLKDEAAGDTAINILFDRDAIPPGPYKENCPDFIVGYNEGYRVSWDSVTGIVNDTLFEDNTKAWSGDHCIDTRIVPGVFFCNEKINTDTPAIIDIAPTALELFGVQIPQHMDGRSLFDASELFEQKKLTAKTPSQKR